MWILILYIYIYNKLCRIRQTCCSSRACRQLWYSLNKNSPEVKMRNFPAASLNVPRWYFHERVVDLPVRLTTDIPGFRKQYMYRYIETQLLINWQQVGTFCKETPKEAWHLRLPPSWNTWTPSNWSNVWAHFTFWDVGVFQFLQVFQDGCAILTHSRGSRFTLSFSVALDLGKWPWLDKVIRRYKTI